MSQIDARLPRRGKPLCDKHEAARICSPIVIAFLAMFLALPADGRGVVGIVLDPQGFGISGAHVEAICDGVKRGAATDASGRFEVVAPGNGRCAIVVRHRDFEPYHEALSHITASVQVRLQLAHVRQVVDVVAASEEPITLRRSLTSVVLFANELEQISNNTEQLIRYAALRAGSTSGSGVVYVNGLPTSVLPSAEAIARLAVNADPFSSEFSDGDQTRIDITTRGSSRDFRVGLGGASLGAGGRNVLRPHLRSESATANLRVSGGVPGLPLSFAARTNGGYSFEETPITAIDAGASPIPLPRSATVGTRSTSGSLNLDCPCSDTMQGHFSYYDSRSTGTNVGVGGLNLPDSGFGSQFWTKDIRATLSHVGRQLTFRGGLSLALMRSNLRANSEDAGVMVLGNFIAGGAPMRSNEARRSNWTWKSVVEPTAGTPMWKMGITLSRSTDFGREEPNPLGTVEFESLQEYLDALAGRANGTLVRKHGDGVVQYASQSAALFAERAFLHSAHAMIIGGVRADYQSAMSMRLSPRLSGAAEWRKIVVRVGGGLFTHNLPTDVFVRAIKGDPFHLQQVIASNVPLGDMLSSHFGRDQAVHSELSSDLTRSREVLVKTSIERPFGSLTPGIEYTWTRSRHLLGSRRVPDGSALRDIVESSRSGERHRIHSQFSYKWRAHRLIANYDWICSRDDTDGFLSFPAHQDNVRAEWARSTGISPHNVTLLGIVRLPGAISLNVIETWRSSAPYNITTGLDLDGNGLYSDRGGRERNSGNGPSYGALSVYAFRRIALPTFPTRGRRKLYLNLGVHGDNLLGSRNYLSLNSVAGSGSFGLPLAALPGRSIRLSLNLD